ncbi:hypothetical protein GTO89_00685 [Heliobacterium gestii]|uniref:Uncharacterized protein n=1 Tax=Heliomicrobium gestii TaxID=2699 RepID=A0A845LFD5_HELGE|nr:hypothetical protein [Heliomicrobium gestii]MBM7865283.1 hypothetical protein [Heliomicrobium gestii]MZP41546.1 hypothetical protein [Heliomicrobium gestii]
MPYSHRFLQYGSSEAYYKQKFLEHAALSEHYARQKMAYAANAQAYYRFAALEYFHKSRALYYKGFFMADTTIETT